MRISINGNNMMHMRQNRGFTIFFASLVTALALAIGLAIYDLTVRELDLSATGSQSQYAIYAADTGAECALYLDTKCALANCVAGSAFATSSGSAPPASGVICNNQDIAQFGTPPSPYVLPTAGWTAWSMVRTASSATTTFWMALSSNVNGPCARVEVSKSGAPTKTVILAHGYNTCLTGNQQLERALQVSY
jgi:hypothetical protein